MTIVLLTLLTNIFEVKAISGCLLPADSNTSQVAPFWCSMTANVQIKAACTTSVEETIVVPWSTGVMTRIIPHQSNQRLVNVVCLVGEPAFSGNATPGKASTLTSSFTTAYSGDINTAVEIDIPVSTTPLSIVVRYAIVPGVVEFSECDSGIPKFSDLSTQPKRTIMLTRWAMGGFSTENVHSVNVHFILESSSSNGIVDITLYKGEGFSTNTSVNSEGNMITSAVGNTANITPSEIFMFLRTWTSATITPCRLLRDCLSELAILQEGKEPQRPIGVIIVGVVTAVFVLIIALAAFLWWRRDKKVAVNEKNEDEVEIPRSLQHFAYDTGDESSSRNWERWTGSPPAQQ